MRFKIILLVAFGCVLLAWMFRVQLGRERGKTVPKRLGTSIATVPADAAPVLLRALHPVLPYSVIPGGVYSRAELVRKIEGDAVVRQHYAGFEISQARLLRLTQKRLQYVSYRKGDRIYWTKKPLVIPRGELLITDGRQFARTRCGNRLSEVPHARVLANEPTAELALPQFEPEFLDTAMNMPLSASGSALLEPPQIDVPREYLSPEQIFRQLPPGEALPLAETLLPPRTVATESPPARGSRKPQTTPPPPVVIPEPRFLGPCAAFALCVLLGTRLLRTRIRPTTRC